MEGAAAEVLDIAVVAEVAAQDIEGAQVTAEGATAHGIVLLGGEVIAGLHRLVHGASAGHLHPLVLGASAGHLPLVHGASAGHRLHHLHATTAGRRRQPEI